MLLQHQSDGSAQARQNPFSGSHMRRMALKKAHVHFRYDSWPKSPPLTGELTDNDNFLGSQSCNEHTHPSAECMHHAVQGLGCKKISGLRQSEQILERQSIGRLDRFVVVAQGRPIGCVDFPTSPAATGAGWSVGIE